MAHDTVLRRTALGHDELARRALGLGPRHRTALLLINGQRTRAQLLQLGRAAGVPDTAFDELLAWHLAEGGAPQDTAHIELPLAAPAAEPADTTLLPTQASLMPESTWADGGAAAPGQPAMPLEQARSLLLQALHDAAPWSGALLARRVRRAPGAAELAALCDEVRQRVQHQGHASLRVAQALKQAQHLLATQPASAR